MHPTTFQMQAEMTEKPATWLQELMRHLGHTHPADG